MENLLVVALVSVIAFLIVLFLSPLALFQMGVRRQRFISKHSIRVMVRKMFRNALYAWLALAAYYALNHLFDNGASPIWAGDGVASLVICAVGLTCFVSLSLVSVLMVEWGTLRFPVKDEDEDISSESARV